MLRSYQSDISLTEIIFLSSQPEEMFSSFDEDPLGTASLAQVHRAILAENGMEVAVKVQHRYVKNHSFVDIYTMDFLVKSVKFFFPQVRNMLHYVLL